MSKQKKQLRFNQKIKKIFDGDGFDEGIVRLDSDELITLAMLLELNVSRAEDSDLVKQLRRAWSEGEIELRRIIVEYLSSLNKIFPSSTSKDAFDKSEQIESVIAQISCSEDEADILRKHFSEVRAKKITVSKMQRFLDRYQEQHKRDVVIEQAKGTLDAHGDMEFFHPFELSLFGDSFKKIFVLHIKGISELQWDQMSQEELLNLIEERKNEVIKSFGANLEHLISQISDEDHPTLDKETRIKWLKGLEPESTLENFALPQDILYKIVSNQTQLHNLIITKTALIAIKKATYTFDEGEKIIYTFDYTMPLWKISASILKGEPITIEAEMQAMQKSLIENFQLEYEALKQELLDEGLELGKSDEQIKKFLHKELKAFYKGDKTLTLSKKVRQKIITDFALETVDLRRQQQREALLARTIRDFKALFPLARTLKRKIIFNVGPTNSGKTYAAMQVLKQADTGVYLAPLRLLALEGYEKLREYGVATTLLTGEEEIFDEEAGHISSTIEMADFEMEVDVAIIDEMQMIGDRDRGWAWANALIGIPAKEVYLTGSSDVLASVKILCEWLGEELEVIEFKRKTPQEILPHVTSVDLIEKGTALIAFSRSDVLRYRQRLSRKYKVSVIYGNLSPEVRREEARRFREGESDIIVATDAIAMGLNLPIKTLLFTKDSKFDGESRRLLAPTEVQQIAGRAGRYGIEEKGYIGALQKDVLGRISDLMAQKLPDISPPFKVMANIEHIKLIASILQTNNLEAVLRFFSKHMEFDGPFRAFDFDSMIELSQILDRYEIKLEDKFLFSTAPVSSAPYVMEQYERYVRSFAVSRPIHYIPLEDLPAFADTENRLRDVEDRIKEISLYLWLAYKYEELFIDRTLVLENRMRLNNFIEASLQQGAFIKKCRTCSKALPMDYEFAICQSCFIQQNRVKRKEDSNRTRPSRSRRR